MIGSGRAPASRASNVSEAASASASVRVVVVAVGRPRTGRAAGTAAALSASSCWSSVGELDRADVAEQRGHDERIHGDDAVDLAAGRLRGTGRRRSRRPSGSPASSPGCGRRRRRPAPLRRCRSRTARTGAGTPRGPSIRAPACLRRGVEVLRAAEVAQRQPAVVGGQLGVAADEPAEPARLRRRREQHEVGPRRRRRRASPAPGRSPAASSRAPAGARRCCCRSRRARTSARSTSHGERAVVGRLLEVDERVAHPRQRPLERGERLEVEAPVDGAQGVEVDLVEGVGDGGRARPRRRRSCRATAERCWATTGTNAAPRRPRLGHPVVGARRGTPRPPRNDVAASSKSPFSSAATPCSAEFSPAAEVVPRLGRGGSRSRASPRRRRPRARRRRSARHRRTERRTADEPGDAAAGRSTATLTSADVPEPGVELGPGEDVEREADRRRRARRDGRAGSRRPTARRRGRRPRATISTGSSGDRQRRAGGDGDGPPRRDRADETTISRADGEERRRRRWASRSAAAGRARRATAAATAISQMRTPTPGRRPCRRARWIRRRPGVAAAVRRPATRRP